MNTLKNREPIDKNFINILCRLLKVEGRTQNSNLTSKYHMSTHLQETNLIYLLILKFTDRKDIFE